jgi:hypothetical protein
MYFINLSYQKIPTIIAKIASIVAARAFYKKLGVIMNDGRAKNFHATWMHQVA